MNRTEINNRLQRHLQAIAIPRNPFKNPTGHQQVVNYLEQTFQSTGLRIDRHYFAYQKKSHYNIVARTEAVDKRPVLVIGAHYDSVPDCPGGDDNASGVAVLLELARLFAAEKLKTKFRVEFIAFDLEETDLNGSAAYAEALMRDRHEVLGMISLEMLGFTRSDRGSQKYPAGLSLFYPSRGDFIAVIGSLKSPFFFRRTLKAFRRIHGLPTQGLIVPGTGTLIPDVRRSDHASFWDRGLPAVLVTDTSFLRNPNYHTPNDRWETLNVPFMASIVEALHEVILSY